MNKITLEVKNGCIVSVHSTETIEVVIIDHDLIEGNGSIEVLTYEPDFIDSFENSLNTIIEDNNLESENIDGIINLFKKEIQPQQS